MVLCNTISDAVDSAAVAIGRAIALAAGNSVRGPVARAIHESIDEQLYEAVSAAVYGVAVYSAPDEGTP